MTKTEREARAADLAEISANLRSSIAAWMRGQDGAVALAMLSLIELQHQQIADLDQRIEQLENDVGTSIDERLRSLEERIEYLERHRGADEQRY